MAFVTSELLLLSVKEIKTLLLNSLSALHQSDRKSLLGEELEFSLQVMGNGNRRMGE